MLEPKSQEIPFRFGLDLTEDEEGSPNGALELENFDFNLEGALVRRNGFTKLSGTTAGPTEAGTSENRGLISNGETLGILQRGHVVPNVAGGNGDYAGFGPFDHDTLGTYWNGVRTQAVDIATLTHGTSGNKYLCVVATVISEASGTELTDATADYEVHAKVVDLSTRSVVYDGRIAGGGAYGARVVVFTSPNRFGIFYNVGSSFKFNYLDVSSSVGVTLGSAVNVVTGTDHRSNTGAPDVVCDGTNAYAAVCDSSALKVKKVDFSGAVVASNTLGSNTTENAILLLTNGTLCVVNTSGVVYEMPSSLGALTFSSGPTAPGGTVKQVALVETVANSQLTILLDTTTTVRVATYNVTTLVAPVYTLTAPNVQLLGKPWYHSFPTSGRQAYVAVGARNAATSGYRTVVIMAASSMTAVGQVSFDETGAPHQYLASLLLGSVLPDPTDASATRYLLASLADIETSDAGANSGGVLIDAYVRRVRVSRLSFSVTNVVTSAAFGGLVHVSGSLPLTWDGSTLGPAAFVDAPAAPVLTSPNAGNLTGVYAYKVVYEVSDERGNIQVSPPSVVASTTVSGKKITVTHAVSPLAYRSLGGLRNLRVKIYRTAAGGSTYNLAHTYTAVYGGTVTVDDNVLDATLAQTEEIYADGSAGSALESEPAPPLRFLCAHRNRLFGIRSDVPQNIAFTQETTDPLNPRWHAVLNHRVDNDGGPPTALASVYDKVLVFQGDQICAFYGVGPDGTGSGAFAQPEVVARGVGVADADRGSVVTTPLGVFFKHRSGIHVIGPDFQVSPVGRAVQSLVGSDTCVRGRFLPSRHQVWFLFQDPSTLTTRQYVLIYDTRFNRWVKWTTPVVFEDVIEHAGTVYAISRTALFKLDTTTCIDTGGSTSLFSQVIGLPWYRGPDRAQELRLWKVHLAGRKVAGAQNDATIALQVYTQDERKPKSSTAADNTLTWAGSTVTGLASNFLLSARAVSQRCRAFRCRLTVTPQTTSATSTWLTLGALVYDFGALMGRGKQPSGNRPTIA
jgi:hypothetical protein